MSDYVSATKNRRSFRFSLCSVLLGTTLLGVLLGVGVRYEVSWIRQRRELLAEGNAIFERTTNYLSGVTSTDIAPKGPTIWQRLLVHLGEPEQDRILVYYLIGEDDHFVTEEGLQELEATDYSKVQRARDLFPEATIVAVFVHRVHLADSMSEIKELISE